MIAPLKNVLPAAYFFQRAFSVLPVIESDRSQHAEGNVESPIFCIVTSPMPSPRSGKSKHGFTQHLSATHFCITEQQRSVFLLTAQERQLLGLAQMEAAWF